MTLQGYTQPDPEGGKLNRKVTQFHKQANKMAQKKMKEEEVLWFKRYLTKKKKNQMQYRSWFEQINYKVIFFRRSEESYYELNIR